jgi:hypothetical protein
LEPPRFYAITAENKEMSPVTVVVNFWAALHWVLLVPKH